MGCAVLYPSSIIPDGIYPRFCQSTNRSPSNWFTFCAPFCFRNNLFRNAWFLNRNCLFFWHRFLTTTTARTFSLLFLFLTPIIQMNNIIKYFFYEKNKATNLNYEFLSSLETKKNKQYVIYADTCLLSEEFMRKHNIIFKKIPRDITRF